ncbi:MAG: TonB family protein [Desulfuromonas sp.]|nr:TonB family protein [Desulfuromonas sp.]
MARRFWLQNSTVQLGLAVVATLAINLLLFWLMPQLIGQQQPRRDELPAVSVSVVRVSPPSPSPRQQAAQKPPEQQVVKQRIAQRTPKPQVQRLKLNLQLQPEIPSSLGGVAMPEVQLTRLEPVPSVFDSAALDRPLTPLAQSPFIYPLRAKRLGIEGWVRVKMLISTTGDVEQVQILEAQPKDMFESTVERGVRGWRFTPGTIDGEAVRSWVVTTIRFELES